jgi:hypothetical protein
VVFLNKYLLHSFYQPYATACLSLLQVVHSVRWTPFLRTKSDLKEKKKKSNKTAKTYNSADSPVITHLTTSPPVTSLSTAERTGSAVFTLATAPKSLNFPVCGDLYGLALFLNAVY